MFVNDMSMKTFTLTTDLMHSRSTGANVEDIEKFETESIVGIIIVASKNKKNSYEICFGKPINQMMSIMDISKQLPILLKNITDGVRK